MKRYLYLLPLLFSVSFLMPQVASAACNAAPTDASAAATSITTTAGTVNGNVSSAGGGTCTVTARGFATSTSATLAAGSTATSSLGGTTGAYSASFNATALSPNTTYYFRAYAINANSTGFGSILSFITLPDTPTALQFSSIADTTLQVGWTAPAGGASTYTLEQCTNGTNTCSRTTSIAATSQSASLLTGNTSYDFAVQGVNATGAGAFTATSTQLTLPSAAGNPTYDTVTLTSINVNWGTPTGGASTYNLEYCQHGTNTCTLTTGDNASPQNVTGLTFGTTYDFALQGVNATGAGAFSATTTQATLTPVVQSTNPHLLIKGGSYSQRGGSITIR